MTYTGRCNCGAIAVVVEAEPVATRQCWCRQCQKIAAGGATHNAIFPTEAITITGKRTETSYTAASGSTLTQEFCPSCGTQVLGRSSARPQFRTIRFGLLDEGHGLTPEAAIWLDEAPAYAQIDPDIQHWPRQPPPPGRPPSA